MLLLFLFSKEKLGKRKAYRELCFEGFVSIFAKIVKLALLKQLQFLNAHQSTNLFLKTQIDTDL